MKKILRDIVSRIPGLRYWVARRIFLGPSPNTHRFLGVFPTYAAAMAHIPAKLDQGFDDPEPGAFSDEPSDRDEATIRILAEILPAAKLLFDLGGNVGMCFYQYRRRLAYPPDFRWMVCDVPSVNEQGRVLAAQRGETQLEFADDRKAADGADVYLTNGALQYFDKPFSALLRELPRPPRHIIVNRVPLSDTSSFYTLQNMGISIVPYYIANRREFIAGVEALGYRLAETWQNDRFCDILLRPERRVSHYYGFHFAPAS